MADLVDGDDQWADDSTICQSLARLQERLKVWSTVFRSLLSHSLGPAWGSRKSSSDSEKRESDQRGEAWGLYRCKETGKVLRFVLRYYCVVNKQ